MIATECGWIPVSRIALSRRSSMRRPNGHSAKTTFWTFGTPGTFILCRFPFLHLAYFSHTYT